MYACVHVCLCLCVCAHVRKNKTLQGLAQSTVATAPPTIPFPHPLLFPQLVVTQAHLGNEVQGTALRVSAVFMHRNLNSEGNISKGSERELTHPYLQTAEV